MHDHDSPHAIPTPQASEQAIANLVDRFYDKVRADAELGPVFNGAISDWMEHKHTLCEFWSSMVLRSGRYQGNPMGTHRALPPFPKALFHRWLELWRDTAREVFEPPVAEVFIGAAARVAQGLSLGLHLGSLEAHTPDALRFTSTSGRSID
ncbi:group III truncated hemoglobin [Dyella sp. C9]|uniref:group III truncated hemoglobin n=1 Tax=Dyella sp. C9 TaxID=2202154 RepID=UPI0018E4E13C|nr:group III truncated hemoglobin [Dyella sp. C9]